MADESSVPQSSLTPSKKSGAESAWVRVQEKAFTQWMDETVKKRNMSVTDLHKDLESGLNLIHFFELLCNHPLGEKYDPHPAGRIQKIHNIHLALRFLERDMGLKNPGCSAEDIIDAQTKGIKLILGLLWILYRKYRMRVEGVSGEKKGKREEDMLLEWVRSTLASKGFDPSVVQSFRTSFNDGQVFLMLAKAYDGSANKIDRDTLKSKAPAEILETVFDYAEQNMAVSKLLDASEVSEGGMDERALALYTSLFYHSFKAKSDLENMSERMGEANLRLELEHKGKDELIKMNYEMNDQLTKLKEVSESTHKELIEARERIEELEKQLAEMQKERGEMRQQMADLTQEKNAEALKRQTAEDVIKTLTAQVDATHVLCEEGKEKLDRMQLEMDQTKKQLEETSERLKIEIAAKEGGAKELSEKLAEETQKNKALTEQQSVVVQKNQEMESEMVEIKSKLKKEQKQIKEKEKMLTEGREQSQVNTQGLAVLRTNLDSHLGDLHRWQKFLEGRVADVEEPIEEIEKLKVEMQGMSFQDQLNLLSTRLQEENVAMTKILKDKQEKGAAGSSKAASQLAADTTATGEKEKKKKSKKSKKEDEEPASPANPTESTPQ